MLRCPHRAQAQTAFAFYSSVFRSRRTSVFRLISDVTGRRCLTTPSHKASEGIETKSSMSMFEVACTLFALSDWTANLNEQSAYLCRASAASTWTDNKEAKCRKNATPFQIERLSNQPVRLIAFQSVPLTESHGRPISRHQASASRATEPGSSRHKER